MSANSYFIIDNSGQQIPEAKTPDAICVLVQANVIKRLIDSPLDL
jgi:hypothetical protein